MLVPAILWKDDIICEFQKYFYTQDLFFYCGVLDNWVPDIQEEPEEGKYQFAIVHNDNLIGYMAYDVNFYTSNARNFELFSFDRGNPLVGKNLYEEMERLTKRFHRIEWRMIGDNPAERGYDTFCKKHNGNKYVLKDALKDKDGNYHDDVIYEIISIGV